MVWVVRGAIVDLGACNRQSKLKGNEVHFQPRQKTEAIFVEPFGPRWRKLAIPIRMAASDPHPPGTKLSRKMLKCRRVLRVGRKEQRHRVGFYFHYGNGEVGNLPKLAATPPPTRFESDVLGALEFFRSHTLRDGYSRANLSLPSGLRRRDRFRFDAGTTTGQPQGRGTEECSRDDTE
jgi:hypothetical protein